MKCANCNGINVEGTRFCMYCGTDMMQAGMRQMQPQQMNYGGQPQQQMYQQMPQQRVKLQPYNRPAKRQLSPVERKKRNKIIAIASGAATFVMLLIIIIAVSGSVNVKDYVKVEFTGENGDGKAHAYIDKEAFIMDYTGKIEYTDEYKMERNAYSTVLGSGSELTDEKAAYHFIRDCVSVKVISDNKGELCNGDTVRVRIKYDKNQLKKYDLDLEDEVFEVKVSGLGKDNNKKASKKKYSVDDVIDMQDWDF